jgi:hypothetical protein
MIRLAVCGITEAECDEISRRVRSAAVIPMTDSQFARHDIDFCAAVAILGSRLPAPSDVETWVQSHRPLLLATDSVLSTDGWDLLIDRGAATGGKAFIVNPDHSLPSRQILVDELQGTKFGIPGLIRSHRWEAPLSMTCEGADRALDPTGLPAPLVRDIELAMWLKSSGPNVVHAIERPGAESDPCRFGVIQVHLGFSDGGMALLDYADTLPAGDGYQSLSAICSHGAMYADDESNHQLAFLGGRPVAARADESVVAQSRLIQQFVDELLLPANTIPRRMTNGIVEWRRTRAVARAVRQSLEDRRAILLEGN